MNNAADGGEELLLGISVRASRKELYQPKLQGEYIDPERNQRLIVLLEKLLTGRCLGEMTIPAKVFSVIMIVMREVFDELLANHAECRLLHQNLKAGLMLAGFAIIYVLKIGIGQQIGDHKRMI